MHENSWVDNLVWGLLLLFLVPSGLVVASWNSLPGSRLYQVKIFMESSLLAVTPTSEAKGTLHVAFTERRFSEATQLLANTSSTQGLVYLNNEMLQAKKNIENAPTQQARSQMAKQYVATLKTINTQLQQQRQIYAQSQNGGTSAPPPGQKTVFVTERVVVQQPIYIVQQQANAPNGSTTQPTTAPTVAVTAAPTNAPQTAESGEKPETQISSEPVAGLDDIIGNSNQYKSEISQYINDSGDTGFSACNGPESPQECRGHKLGYCTGTCKCQRTTGLNCACNVRPSCNDDEQ